MNKTAKTILIAAGVIDAREGTAFLYYLLCVAEGILFGAYQLALTVDHQLTLGKAGIGVGGVLAGVGGAGGEAADGGELVGASKADLQRGQVCNLSNHCITKFILHIIEHLRSIKCLLTNALN